MSDQSTLNNRERRLQHLGEAIFVIFGAYLCAVVAISALDPVVGAFVGGPETSMARIVQTVIQFVVIGIAVGWYTQVIDVDRLIPVGVPRGRGLGAIAVGTLVLLGGQYVVNEILQWAGFSPGANQAVLAGVGNPTYFLVMIPVSLLFVGPAEELLFRGAVQGRLRHSWGRWQSIIGATVLFGLIHIPAITGGFGAKFSYALVAGLLGVVLGYLYDETRNIVVPAVIHGSYNATLFGVLYLGEIGALGQ